MTGANINFPKLGTVPSATNATTAGTANALPPMEPTRIVGAAGQPSFLDGTSNVPGGEGLNFQSAGFYKDHDGVVHLRSAVTTGKKIHSKV